MATHPAITPCGCFAGLDARLGCARRIGDAGPSDALLIEGVMKAGLLYMPQLRPGLEAEQILAEELVMVATFADADMDTSFDDFVFIDWGPAFVAARA
jgi:hypothetical protein